MENVLFSRPYFIKHNAIGLCNQLSFIINSILYCSRHNISKIIISDFISDNSKLSKTKISNIINLQETNKYLEKYNVVIVDLTNLKQNNLLLSNAFTGYEQGSVTSLDTNWINNTDFFAIYNNISFQPFFYRLANNLIQEIKIKLGDDIKINIVHLRLEYDALIHWSKINSMPIKVFKRLLEKKYIELINKFINKNMFTIVMTYSTNNNVIKYLNTYNYNYYIKKKNISLGRECNALQDLILSRKMNNFLIGVGGSTFSSFIVNSTNKKKTVLFDINHILKPEVVCDY